MKNDDLYNKPWIAQFRARQVSVPGLSGSFGDVTGTSTQTSTLIARLTDDDQASENILFALMGAAFAPEKIRADLGVSTDANPKIAKVNQVRIPAQLPDELASSVVSEEPERDVSGAYVDKIVISPATSPNNAIVTFVGDPNSYLLSGSVGTLLEVFLFAKMTNTKVLATATGYVDRLGHGYMYEVYADPFSQRNDA